MSHRPYREIDVSAGHGFGDSASDSLSGGEGLLLAGDHALEGDHDGTLTEVDRMPPAAQSPGTADRLAHSGHGTGVLQREDGLRLVAFADLRQGVLGGEPTLRQLGDVRDLRQADVTDQWKLVDRFL